MIQTLNLFHSFYAWPEMQNSRSVNDGNSEKVICNASPHINSFLTSKKTLHTSVIRITFLMVIRLTLAYSEKYMR